MTYEVSLWMALPFVMLLAMIALGPLFFADWWSKHYPKVAVSLALVTLVFYCFFLPGGARTTVAHTGIEYISFIVLIGALFVVSGGIHINVKGEATPRANTTFLLIGAIVSNLLGTTGASMLLIRPWLRMNHYRLTGHHVVFFIFIVSNVGGCLTPIGDPPLFLGYLKGIPFWWVFQKCWPMWLTGVGLLLAMFYWVDRRNYLKAPKQVRATIAEPPDEWRFEGLSNLVFLGIIMAAIFVKNPPFLREALMIGAAIASYYTTRKPIHEANHFTFHPIIEVAILFIGIFATMMPALDWLEANAGRFGTPSPALFFWGSGTLSSVLDNAPTYLSFLSAACGSLVPPDVAEAVRQLALTNGAGLAAAPEMVRATFETLRHASPQALGHAGDIQNEIALAYLLANPEAGRYIVAISVGAVFFGANTYIGNGPNFMVKAIADHAKAHTPGFLAYVYCFTLPIMLPMLVVVWWLFFRGGNL